MWRITTIGPRCPVVAVGCPLNASQLGSAMGGVRRSRFVDLIAAV